MSATIDFYERRAMLESIRDLKKPQTFLTMMFFSVIKVFETESVDIDIKKGDRQVLAYVQRTQQGQVIEESGHTTKTWKPPYLKPKMPLTAKQLRERDLGQFLYVDNKSPAEAAADKVLSRWENLEDKITRNIELQAKEALFDGLVNSLDIDGNQLGEVLNFGRTGSHAVTLTGTARWSDSGSDPSQNLDDARDAIGKDATADAKVVIMAGDVWRIFITHAKIIAELNLRRGDDANRVAREQQAKDWGAVYRMEYNGFAIYTYSEYITLPAAASSIALVPAGKLLIADENAMTTQAYGAIEVVDEESSEIIVGERFPTSWTDKDPSRRWMQLHAAPLCITNEPDAYVVIDALNGGA